MFKNLFGVFDRPAISEEGQKFCKSFGRRNLAIVFKRIVFTVCIHFFAYSLLSNRELHHRKQKREHERTRNIKILKSLSMSSPYRQVGVARDSSIEKEQANDCISS